MLPPFFVLIKNQIQLISQRFQIVNHFFVIHSLRSYDADRTSHAFAQLIGSSYHAAVLHGLPRRLIADVNLAGAEALAAQLTAEGLSAMAVHMDVGSEEEVEAGFDKMMETYGSCDLVMSNAGVQIVHPFDEYPFSDWKKMMSIHADGAFLVSRAAFRRMKASGKGGRIVFTGSVQSFVGSKLKEPYNFAKHGVAGLAKAIAREGAEYGIYTYTICPSYIKTPLVEKQIPEQARDLGITEEEVVKNIMLRDTVDGVFTTVEDVANTLFFLSNDQGALTGQSLRLTHGWAMM